MTQRTASSLLDDRYGTIDGTFHATGIQALARLPLDVRRADARARRSTAVFIAGYEGSPLGGYDLELQRHPELLLEHDVVFKPAVNEELAATAVQGTQLAANFPDKRVAGITGFWYGKSPGLDRASDALRHNNLSGTHPDGGAVALVGDDPGAKSSTVPGSSEMLLADLGMPTLYPADPQDVLDLGLHAVAMSRVSGLWVGFKMATNVADGSASVTVHPERIRSVTPRVLVDGKPYVHEVTTRFLQPTLAGLEQTRNGVRLDLAVRYASENGINRIVCSSPSDRIGIVVAGKTYYDLRHALEALGLDDDELERRGIRLLRLGMLHPLEPTIVKQFADGLHEIIVVEEKRPFVEAAIKALLYGSATAPTVTGKRDDEGVELLPTSGELDPDLISRALARRLLRHGDVPTVVAWEEAQQAKPLRVDLPLAVSRTPYFCSGCPHNSSTKAPKGSLVGAGIGCHAMVLLMDPDEVGEVAGLTQMGGEGAQWIGMEPFLSRGHLLQNLGDGTFHHSGSLAIRAAVASGANITYKLLYNSAVAMTGGQQAAGGMAVPEITRALTAEGVSRIIVTTDDKKRYRGVSLAKGTEVWHRDRLVEAQEELAQEQGVTVLIHDQECATELRRKRKRDLVIKPAQRVVINKRLCEGCGDCGEKSNCLSVQPIETEFGRKTHIDQSSCNLDFSCLKGDCPSFLTVVPGDAVDDTASGPTLEANELPDPVTMSETQGTHTTRILGVGGAGVVTLSQVLSVAATIAGRQVRSLDQTGLAQKGGAVISDIRIGDDRVLEQTNKSANEECDLYLGADLLVAADAKNLAVTAPDRSVAVVSTAEVPTGRMVADPAVSFPDRDGLIDRIREATRDDTSHFLDARELAVTLFGQDQFSNMFLAGVAYQIGALPIAASAIETAISANGVKVDVNLQAFRRGRQYVADPEALRSTLATLRGDSPGMRPMTEREREIRAIVSAGRESELGRLLDIRVPDLCAYQNVGYARAYAEFVERVRATESDRLAGSTQIAEAVASNLYKLMAYKDEYEVARLALDPATQASVRSEFGQGAKISYRLHPPVLRALGMKRKLSLGKWFEPVFGVLVRLRGLRGTRFDPFGYARVRKVERDLISEYRAAVEELLEVLGPDTWERGLELASLPDQVRGYEDVKLRHVEAFRLRLHNLRTELLLA